MVDQVNPTGSLGPGLSQALAMAPKAQPVSDNTRPTSASATPPSQADGGSAVSSQTTPEQASQQVNDHLPQLSSNLRMNVDKGTGKTVYQIVSKSTGEVLLQVPSAEVLSMAQKLSALSKEKGSQGSAGVLVDKEG